MRIARKTQALALSMMFGLPVLGGCVGGEVGTDDPTAESELTANKYLALGDSVPFGYNPVDAKNNPMNISKFVGYPENLNMTGAFSTANASCEGETTGSFITYGAPDHGCRAWREANNAMHVTYGLSPEQKPLSQLDYAKAHLAGVERVSIQIGANDLLMLQDSCFVQHQGDPQNIPACLQQGLPATLGGVAQNLTNIIGQLLAAAPKNANGLPRTQIAVVTYYAQNYSNPNDLNFQSVFLLDQTLVKVARGFAQQGFNITVAKGFSAFQIATQVAKTSGDACAAGVLYNLTKTTCDIHPSSAGQKVLAGAFVAAAPASKITETDLATGNF